MAGQMLTKAQIDDVRRALDGRSGGRSMSRPHAVMRDLLTTLDAMVGAVTDAIVEVGPSCIVCGEAIEADNDPCDAPCSGLALRRLARQLASGQRVADNPTDSWTVGEFEPATWGVFDTWDRRWCPRRGTEEEMGAHAVKLNHAGDRVGQVQYRYQPLPLPVPVNTSSAG